MHPDPPPGTLYVVSTPIGNLGDMTFRAVETLRGVSLIVAEDTRHSRALLDRYGITTPVESYHEHNEARATPRLLERLRGGESIALITDAGTPLLSDPGGRLVRGALEGGMSVVPIPGASALLAALVASGLDAERFTFFGFLPRKGRARKEAIRAILSLGHTAVLYEAPTRVADTMGELVAQGAGGREAAVARELTKQFEEVKRGTLATLAMYYADAAVRGEVVIVIGAAAPTVPDESALIERARSLRESGISSREVARVLVEEHGAPRNLAYRLAHQADPLTQ